MTEQERSPAGGTQASSREKGSGLTETAREVGREAKETVKGTVQETGEKVRSQANRAVDEGTTEFASRGDALVEALRAASSTLRERDEEALGRYADQAARQVERFGDQLRRNDLNGFLDGLENFARDHTALFLGSTFVGGLAVARFLRSSNPEGSTSSGDGGRRQRSGHHAPTSRSTTSVGSPAGTTAGAGEGWREEVR